MDELQLRHQSYNENLIKEKFNYKRFIEYLNFYGWSWEINPENSEKNCHGSDITITKDGKTYEVDLKGCQSKYDTVALSYQRSYDGVNWFSTLKETKITDWFVFVDELGNLYKIDFKEVLVNINSYKKSTASKNKAGHFNKVLLIDKDCLERLIMKRRIVK